MNINILKNILLLCLIIFLFLVISNDDRYNTLLNKDKINYLVLLILIYFIYIEIPLSIIIVFLLIILILNKQFYYKYLKNNKYLKEYLPDIESFDNKENVNENNIENFNFSPYKSEISEEENINFPKNNKSNEELFINNTKNKDELKEPFKDKVRELKKHLNNAINNNN